MKIRILSVTLEGTPKLQWKSNRGVFEAGHTAPYSFLFQLNAHLRSKAGQSLTTPRLILLIVGPLRCISCTAETHRFGLLIIIAMRGETAHVAVVHPGRAARY